jgi:hypothetical protein
MHLRDKFTSTLFPPFPPQIIRHNMFRRNGLHHPWILPIHPRLLTRIIRCIINITITGTVDFYRSFDRRSREFERFDYCFFVVLNCCSIK